MSFVRSRALALLALSQLVLACGEPPAPAKQPDARPTTAKAVKSSAPGSTTVSSHSTGTSYEDALAEPEDANALRGEKELSNRELAAPMQRGAFITSCGAPDAMKVTVKIAIREGHVIGATVLTDPDDPAIAECIDRIVRDVQFPVSRRRDSFVTVY
jgi:hypothetical protein